MKVVISGYYGFGNAGDEAILEAIVAELRALRPDIQPVVLSEHPAATAARLGVEAIPRMNVTAVVRALRGASLFISGGGSLLQDATGWGSVPYYTGLMHVARWMGVPVFVYAQGVGPLRRRALQVLTRRALNAAAEVTVRDRSSYEFLRRLGVDQRKLSVTADPVFSLAVWQDGARSSGRSRAEAARRAAGTRPGTDARRELEAGGEESGVTSLSAWKGPVVGVALRPHPGGRPAVDAAVVDAVAAAVGSRLERWDAHVALLPLHPASDGPLLQRLYQRLEYIGLGHRVLHWPAVPSVPARALAARDWLALFARLDVCLTMRLHGLIFSACAGTPCIAVSDDPKLAAHVDELGLPRGLCLVSQVPPSGDQLGARLDEVWEKRVVLRSLLRERAEALAGRARVTAERALSRARR